MHKSLFFNILSELEFRPSLWDTFLSSIRLEARLTRKIVDFDDNKIVVLYHSFNKSSE